MTTSYTGSESDRRVRRATQIIRRTQPHKRRTGVHELLHRALSLLDGPTVLSDLVPHAFGPLGECVARTDENPSVG